MKPTDIIWVREMNGIWHILKKSYVLAALCGDTPEDERERKLDSWPHKRDGRPTPPHDRGRCKSCERELKALG